MVIIGHRGWARRLACSWFPSSDQ